ncbi:MAG: type II restriction endonuclease [Clostridia bacterium]|nr:type II restriction endonuclease [Clostridia bacterium]
MDSSEGSKIAKDGFKNERDIANKFINWKNDIEAQQWLKTMGYNLNEIEYVYAEVLHGYKTDVQVQVTIKLKNIIDAQNLQVKLVSNVNGFNQIDKRWIKNYAEMWEMPDNIVKLLKYYTGELEPYKKNTRDTRRMFMDEFSEQEQNEIIDYFEQNRMLIILDIVKGRGKFAAEWILVAQKYEDIFRWILKPINVAINHYSEGKVEVTNRGNLKIGRIVMQRKGGDAGRKTANMLQFKVNPVELFNLK